MIRVVGPRDGKIPGAINTTSTAKGWSAGLSPFFLGPVKLYNEAVCEYSQNVENLWQYSKVYAHMSGDDGLPNDEYFNWAKVGWNKKRAERYPMGKGAIPLYSWWAGEKLDYIEARAKIYVPAYSVTVAKTDAFKNLINIYNQNEDITLWDFDGYDHLELGMSLKDVLNDPTRKMGHAFVLAAMLEKL
jgi:hypothetical protein